jgi:hypothetical protein
MYKIRYFMVGKKYIYGALMHEFGYMSRNQQFIYRSIIQQLTKYSCKKMKYWNLDSLWINYSESL